MSSQRPALVLNVDDIDANRYEITRILERAGYRVFEAASGSEALGVVTELRPDLIVLDVNLPDLDGFELCRRLKQQPASASIPVLQVSAVHVRGEDYARGLDAGADGYLTRPIEPVVLVASVRSLLRVRQAEEALRRSESLYRRIVETAEEGIWIIDEQARTQFANERMAEMLGTTPQQMAASHSFDFVLDEDREAAWSLFDQKREGITAPFDFRLRRVDGGILWARVSTGRLLDEEGQVQGLLGMFTDVTDHKRLEAELEQRATELQRSNRAKDEFLAMLGHELRNPLHALSNAIELLRHGEIPPLVERSRTILERQVRHMTRLVDDLLDISRITRGRIELRKASVDLAALVARAVESVTPQIEAREHTLSVHLPRQPVQLHADPARLEQVLSNLLHNAAKYTRPGGRIWLTAERDGSELVLRVRDTGVGIDPAMRTRIFDLFAQVDPSVDRSEGGLGIGLTLVRTLIELHGGSVEVHSEGVGQGSEFVVRLPASTGPVPRLDELLPELQTGQARSLDVLIVEDNADSAETLGTLLGLWGHKPRIVHSGVAALEVVRDFQPDVVLLDIGLPGMDGYEVAERLRLDLGPRTPVLVALTGYGQERDRRAAHRAGFDHHLTKPVELPALQRLLADAGLG